MAYPNFENKHLENALFNPHDYFNWSKSNIKNLPTKYIIIYRPKTLNYFKRKYKPKKIEVNKLITIHKHKNIGVVLMTGIGSPHAVTTFEELIAAGGKEFLNIGLAGGLDTLGIFVCNKALRDEGTSYHYISHGDFSYPDKVLTKRFEDCLKKKGIDFKKTTTWTIDAPYRETISEVKHYKKLGVKTVEMETSALFAVAKVRKVKIAAAFVVSDILGEDKWDPQFDAKHVSQKMGQIFDTAIECLSKKN